MQSSITLQSNIEWTLPPNQTAYAQAMSGAHPVWRVCAHAGHHFDLGHTIGLDPQQLVTKEDAYRAARLTGLSILSSLQSRLGSLDRIACWVRAFGMVKTSPGFCDMPGVINGFSDLILEIFGQERGQHSRSAVGVAELPFDIPVEIEGEVLIN